MVISYRVVFNLQLLFFRIYFVFVHAASHRHGRAAIYSSSPLAKMMCEKKSIFPGTQSSPVLLGCCCVWTGGEGGGSTPLPPLKDRKRKEKQKSVSGRLLSHRCHCDGAPQAERGEGWWGSRGRDGTLLPPFFSWWLAQPVVNAKRPNLWLWDRQAGN